MPAVLYTTERRRARAALRWYDVGRMVARVRAVHDEALGARIVDRTPLRYSNGPDPSEDRPAHARAASGLVRFGRWLAVVQDDADFIGLVDATTGAVESIALPRRGSGARQFDDDRGNKDAKRDFEACIVTELDGVETLVAFGSGSTAARESVLLLPLVEAEDRSTGERARGRVVHAPALYAALRSSTEFSGTELNVEGAIRLGGAVRLFQRGNGAPRGAVSPVDATCDLDWSRLGDFLQGRTAAPPTVTGVVDFDLGAVSGTRLAFTDATVLDDRAALYLAAAEASPDALRDGPIAGAAIGVISERYEPRPGPASTPAFSAPASVRYALLRDSNGALATEKAEGIALSDSPDRVYVVVDADDPRRASELCVVELSGPWR